MTMNKLAFAAAAAVAAMAAAAAPAASGLKTAVFAGGCFWSMEKGFESTPGVVTAVSGYSGGRSTNPTYENHSGHLEAVKVTYDPAKISYAQLVDSYYHNIDPTDPYGQICDKGPSYKRRCSRATPPRRPSPRPPRPSTARSWARRSRWRRATPRRSTTPRATTRTTPRRIRCAYERYRIGCGRDRALRVVWGGTRKPTDRVARPGRKVLGRRTSRPCACVARSSQTLSRSPGREAWAKSASISPRRQPS